MRQAVCRVRGQFDRERMSEKKRILLVDDEVAFARLLKMNLEKTEQYEVRTENWPEDALEAARQFKPNLVLLDIVMPRMPGGNVAAAFRADPEMKDTPIAFLTGALRASQIEENEGTIGGLPCLAKVTKLDDIIKFIEQHARV